MFMYIYSIITNFIYKIRNTTVDIILEYFLKEQKNKLVLQKKYINCINTPSSIDTIYDEIVELTTKKRITNMFCYIIFTI